MFFELDTMISIMIINQKMRIKFSARFLADFQSRAESKKATSQAENPSARALALANSARTHH